MGKKKRTLVVGLGKSGVAACRFLVRRGHAVVALDQADNERTRVRAAELAPLGVEARLGSADWPEDVDQVVTSPGVDPAQLTLYRARKIPVIGELELGCREIAVPYVAVTGTNGKSTVVTNLEKGLRMDGKRVRALGNLGNPVTEWVDSGEEADFLVFEVSSYQLETIETFHPHVAVILNIAPDHISRHPTLKDYLTAKARVADNQTIEDALLLHRDLSLYPELQKTRGRLYWYGRDLDPSRDGLSLGGNRLMWRGEGPGWSREVRLEGLFPHEIDNLMAVVAVMTLLGVSPDSSTRLFEDPARLTHRLERVATVSGVVYLNDSKATNAHAAIAALRAVAGRVIWLVGGEGKGEDLSDLVNAARDCGVGLAICFGRDRGIFAGALQSVVPVELRETLNRAFELAAHRAQPGDTVLLSPAGASFDEFTSFEDRGERFKEWVAALKERAA